VINGEAWTAERIHGSIETCEAPAVTDAPH